MMRDWGIEVLLRQLLPRQRTNTTRTCVGTVHRARGTAHPDRRTLVLILTKKDICWRREASSNPGRIGSWTTTWRHRANRAWRTHQTSHWHWLLRRLPASGRTASHAHPHIRHSRKIIRRAADAGRSSTKRRMLLPRSYLMSWTTLRKTWVCHAHRATRSRHPRHSLGARISVVHEPWRTVLHTTHTRC